MNSERYDPFQSGRPMTPTATGLDPSPVNYARYLHLDELLDLNRPITQVRAERRFIALHQISELLLNLEIDELELAISALCEADPDFNLALGCLRRARHLTAQLTGILVLLEEVVDPADFATFRQALGSASGAQSEQFWRVERISRPRYGVGVADPGLWDAFAAAIGIRADDGASLPAALEEHSLSGQLATALREHDQAWGRWREQHAKLVDTMIGANVPGTGGSSGSRYLWSRVRDMFYPALDGWPIACSRTVSES